MKRVPIGRQHNWNPPIEKTSPTTLKRLFDIVVHRQTEGYPVRLKTGIVYEYSKYSKSLFVIFPIWFHTKRLHWDFDTEGLVLSPFVTYASAGFRYSHISKKLFSRFRTFKTSVFLKLIVTREQIEDLLAEESVFRHRTVLCIINRLGLGNHFLDARQYFENSKG